MGSHLTNPSYEKAGTTDKSLQESKRESDEWSHVWPSDYRKPSETAFVPWEALRREYIASQRSSTSSEWSLVDIDPNDEQQELEKVDCLTHPFVIVDPPPPPSCDNGEHEGPNHANQNDTQHLSADYQGARSYWQQAATVDSMTDAMRDLKVAQWDTRGAARDHFQNQQQQFMDIQKERWQVEASWDQVERHVDEVKQSRTREDLERAEKKRQNVAHMRRYLGPTDRQDEALSADMNAREQAIMNARGKTAQHERAMAPAGYGQQELEHPKANRSGDFPYKTGTFIHRDIKPILNENGVRVGWDHNFMPSYKREHMAKHLKGETELVMEVGKMAVQERLPALASSEKFEQTVSRKGKERQTVPQWYTQQSIDELLERNQSSWGPSGHARHDSAAGGY